MPRTDITDMKPILSVFALFFCLFSLLFFSSPSFLSADDQYYHAAHALAYRAGETLKFPALSTMRDGSDLYFLYHILLAPFTAAFDGDNRETLIAGSKIFHSIAGASVFALFFFILLRLLPAETKNPRMYAFLGTIFLFGCSMIFTFRLFLARPHTISIIFLLLGVYFLLRRKNLPLFVLSALFPLFYSVSFVILALPALFMLAECACFKRLPRARANWMPLIAVAGGLSLGVLAHPDSLHYLYNGYTIHLLTLWNSASGAVVEATELAASGITPRDILWFAPFILTLGSMALRIKKMGIPSVPFETWFLGALSIAFFTLYLFVERAAEYFIPFVTLFIFSSFSSIPEIPFLQKKIISRTAVFLIVIFAVSNAASILVRFKKEPPPDRYRNAALFLQQNSEENAIVFNTAFGQYAPLVFWNNENRYAIGMSGTFAHAKSRENYYRWLHIERGEQVCPKPEC
ncbi:hypothetical protein L0Y49_03715, partial [bacterium]|nr:hypothetical protein [bacterium]